MNARNLTNRAYPSHKASLRAIGTVLVAMLGSAMAAGCISVNAPDKPIVIELNINIKQEVLYKIQQDVENTIEQNSGFF